MSGYFEEAWKCEQISGNWDYLTLLEISFIVNADTAFASSTALVTISFYAFQN